MEAEVFDIEDTEALRFKNLHDFLKAGNVGSRKNARLDPGIERLTGDPLADAVDQCESIGFETASHHPSQLGIVASTDVFEHPDRNKGVAGSAHIAVVIFHEFDLTLKFEFRNALTSPGELFNGDVVGANANAESLSHVNGQGSPATSGFVDHLPGLKPKFAANMVHFGDLGLLQSHLRSAVIGTGVDELITEPMTVKIISNIIVVVDAIARIVQGRCVVSVTASPGGKSFGGDGTHVVHIDHQLGEIPFNFDITAGIGIAKPQCGSISQIPKGRTVPDQDASLAGVFRNRKLFSIPQHKRNGGRS